MGQASAMLTCLILSLGLSACKRVQDVRETWADGTPKTIWVQNADGQIVEVRTFHANGIRKTVEEWSKGRLNGRWEEWDRTGTPEATGYWKDGIRSGRWTWWHSRDKARRKGQYLGGAKEGIWNDFDYEGNVTARMEYHHGVPTGVWKSWRHGALETEGTCAADSGMRSGLGWERHWWPNGTLRSSCHCKNGRRHGECAEWDSSGTTLRYSNWDRGMPDGEFAWFHADGRLWRSGSYRLGTRNGTWMYLYQQHDPILLRFLAGSAHLELPCADSIPPLCAESTWVAGRLQGTTRTLIPGGGRGNSEDEWIEEDWNQGQRLRSRTFRDGRMVSDGAWSNDKRHGTWRVWWENGRLRDSLNYRNGELFGPQVHFDTLGRVLTREIRQGKNMPVLMQINNPASARSR